MIKLLKWILSLVCIITLITQFRYFSKQAHALAIKKGVLLWVIFTSPVLLTLLLAPIGNDYSQINSILDEFQSILSRDGIYVYTVSLLAPFIFIGIGRFITAYNRETSTVSDRKTKLEFEAVFTGYWFQFWVAIILLILSVFAFAFKLLQSAPFKETRLHGIVEFCPLGIYCFALFLWYLSLLDENNQASDVIAEARNTEKKNVDSFSARVRQKSK